MRSQHDRKRSLREVFRPPTGPFPKIGLTDVLQDQIIDRLRAYVARSGWRYRMQQAAQAVIDLFAAEGLRIEVSCATLAARLGLSRSMGGYYFRRLREVGFLDLYRQHYVDWDATEKLRDQLDSDDVFVAAPNVYELDPRRWEHLFRSYPRRGQGKSPMAEKRPPSWDLLVLDADPPVPIRA